MTVTLTVEQELLYGSAIENLTFVLKFHLQMHKWALKTYWIADS